jgi:hypothetical protein
MAARTASIMRISAIRRIVRFHDLTAFVAR